MKELRIFYSWIWITYGDDCITLAKAVKPQKESSGRLNLILCIRVFIAYLLVREADRSFDYARWITRNIESEN